MRNILLAIVFALALAVFSWSLRELPMSVTIAIRIWNGLVIATLLIWIIRRVLTYEQKLAVHRVDIIDVVKKSEDDRKTAIDELAKQTADIAAALASQTANIAGALAEQTARTATVLAHSNATQVEKLESIGESAKEVMHKRSVSIRDEVLTAVERGTKAAHAAQEEANGVNKKIEELRKDLIKVEQKG